MKWPRCRSYMHTGKRCERRLFHRGHHWAALSINYHKIYRQEATDD